MLAFDLKGPVKVPSFRHNFRYASIFSFKSSRWILIYFGKTKDEFYNHLRKAIDFARRLGEEVKVFQSDDDPLFKSEIMATIIDGNNTEVRKSYPHDHHGNGWIERDISLILNKVRTIMNVYNAPLSFWPWAFMHAAHEINRTPRRCLNGISAYERIFEKKPDISKFAPFYCLGIVKLDKEERTHALSPVGQECRLLAYDEEGKDGYIIYNLETKRIDRRKEVVFDENCHFRNENTDSEEEYENIGFKHRKDLDDEPTLNDDKEFFDEIDQDFAQYGEPVIKKMEQNWKEVIDKIKGELNLSYATSTKSMKAPYSPKTVEEALTGSDADKWEEAIKTELSQLMDRGTFEFVEDTKDKRVAKMKMVLQGSLDNDLQPKYKARLVLCGYSQKKGVDYDETYSPTILKDGIFICICIGLACQFKMKLLDVKGAFLEGYNHHDIYAEIPKVLLPRDHPRLITKVILSLYGEKQAAYEWFERVNHIFVEELGLERLKEECIYVKHNDEGELILLTTIHVDDLLIMGKSDEIVNAFIKSFRKHVQEVKVYPNVAKYLGMEMSYGGNCVYITQQKYIETMFNKSQLDEGLKRKQNCPISPRHEFNIDEDEAEETGNMLDIIGRMRYVADCSRRDILTSLSIISSRGSNADATYYNAAVSIMNYLYTTVDRDIRFSGNKIEDLKLYCFSDASYFNKTDGGDRLGGCFFLGYESAPIYSFSKRDKRISISPMDTEIKAIARNAELIHGYRKLLKELGFPQIEPTPIFTDSLSAVWLFKKGNISGHRSNKQCYSNIKRLLEQREIMLIEIERKNNCSDLMTRLVAGKEFNTSRDRLERGYTKEEITEYITKSIINN
jgi:hypothetical protein